MNVQTEKKTRNVPDIIFAFAFVLCSAPVFAATLPICGTCTYTTIASAIAAAAASGDVIELRRDITEDVSVTNFSTGITGYPYLINGRSYIALLRKNEFVNFGSFNTVYMIDAVADILGSSKNCIN
ncbi:MAG: hypothetical protein LLG37_06470 [Spirochaetia bacterium]|nr:hypothetical protein [Spirochaetia bacterium]